MKRVLILLVLVVVIACFFAMPASAVTEQNHVFIPFDQLTVIPERNSGGLPLYYWFELTDPYDYSISHGDDYEILLENSAVQSTFSLKLTAGTSSRTAFNFEVYGSQDWASTFQLSAHNFTMRSSDLYKSLTYTPQGNVATRQHTVSINGVFRYITEVNGQYVASSHSITVPETSFVNGIDLMPLIRQQLSAETLRQDIFYFDYLNVVIDNGLPESYTAFTLSGQGQATSRPSFTSWFNQFDLHSYEFTPSDPGDGNFLQWVASMIDTVFNIELFGFVSINEIFNFVVVIGLVFWFLKLTV